MASTERGRGRPKALKSARRDVWLKLRISRAEEIMLTQFMHDAGAASLSDFVRDRLGLATSGYTRRAGEPEPASPPAVSQPAPLEPAPAPAPRPAPAEPEGFVPPWAR